MRTIRLPCSYKSDMETDPFGEKGSVWSFNYFFYNKVRDSLDALVSCQARWCTQRAECLWS